MKIVFNILSYHRTLNWPACIINTEKNIFLKKTSLGDVKMGGKIINNFICIIHVKNINAIPDKPDRY